MQLSRYSSGPGLLPFGFRPMSPENDTELFAIYRLLGGLKWTRTTDLTLIRRAL